MRSGIAAIICSARVKTLASDSPAIFEILKKINLNNTQNNIPQKSTTTTIEIVSLQKQAFVEAT